MALVATSLLMIGCEEKESDVGSALIDPSTMYNGTRDTVYLTGYTEYEDSLETSDYAFELIGKNSDPVMGKTLAYAYSQVGLADANGVNVSESSVVDSAVLRLVVTDVYSTQLSTAGLNALAPKSRVANLASRYRATQQAHIKVFQLGDTLTDRSYYATDTVLTDYSTCFLDTVVSIGELPATLSLPLRSNIYNLLRQQATSAEFMERMKGIKIEVNSDEGDDNMMLTVNFNAVSTRLTIYCKDSTAQTSYDFMIGHKTGSTVKHFVHFAHTYDGTPLAQFANEQGRGDSISGGQALYLQPMGGTKVCMKLDPKWYSNFRKEHPYAVVDYAELTLPVTNGDTNIMGARILAYKVASDSSMTLISDGSDASRYSGYDGYFSVEKGLYRIRVTRHLQQLLQAASDYGTVLVIDARRSSAKSTVLNGYAQESRPRITLVYSE